MIYIILLILIFWGIYKYDINNTKKYKIEYYYYLMFLFVFLSGFSFRLGSDIITYMKEYDSYICCGKKISFDYFLKFENRMPGWILLSTLFKSSGIDFLYLKLFHSLFVNIIVFITIRKFTIHIYTSVLLYFFISYFYFNFEILRESISISIFLLSVPSFIQKNYFKYYIFIFFSLFFHISAVCLIFLPIVRFLTEKKNRLIFSLIITFVGLIFVKLYLINILLSLSEISIFSKLIYHYAFDSEYSISTIKFSDIDNLLFNVGLSLFLIYFIERYKIFKFYSLVLMLGIYAFIYFTSVFIPILFRFNNYFILFYLISIVNIFYFIFKKRHFYLHIRSFLMLLLIFGYFTSIYRMNFTPFRDFKYASYIRYYPYNSIFINTANAQREEFYRLLDNRK
jgi:hypothetical protein